MKERVLPEIESAMRVAEWIAGSGSQKWGIQAMRIAIAIIFLWIGALKFVPYEADSITPFVANNPVMRLFYKYPDEYKVHLTREGELVPAERAWQTNNNTYVFSRGLEVLELAIGLLTLIGVVSARGWTRRPARKPANCMCRFLAAPDPSYWPLGHLP